MPRAPQHRQQRQPVREPQRELSASERGYGWHWTKVAEQIRERDELLCQRCLREGGLAQAMDEMMSRPKNKDGTLRNPAVGHIKPGHVCSQEEFYDPANLEVICERHNRLQEVEDAKAYGSARRLRYGGGQ